MNQDFPKSEFFYHEVAENYVFNIKRVDCSHKQHILRPPTGRQMAILPMPISQQPFNRS